MSKGNSGIRKQLGLDSELYKTMLKQSELLDAKEDKTSCGVGQPFKPKDCFWFGVCICKQPDIQHFFGNLCRIFRKMFWKRKKVVSEQRKVLDQSSVFLQLSLAHDDRPALTDNVGNDQDDHADDDSLEAMYADCVLQNKLGTSGLSHNFPSKTDFFLHMGYKIGRAHV